jgi:hypothetical protein
LALVGDRSTFTILGTGLSFLFRGGAAVRERFFPVTEGVDSRSLSAGEGSSTAALGRAADASCAASAKSTGRAVYDTGGTLWWASGVMVSVSPAAIV